MDNGNKIKPTFSGSNPSPKAERKNIVVGITQGDINGIGYEVIIKTLAEPQSLELFTPLVFGNSKVASYHRKLLCTPDFSFNLVKKPDQAHDKRANIYNIVENEIKIEIGKSTKVAGEMSLLSLNAAIEAIQAGHIDVLVTAPLDKNNIQSDRFRFPGHTEYLASKFKADDYLMLMISRNIRIGVITGHIPVSRVSSEITSDLIYKKIKLLNASLRRDFGIDSPRIAVLGLNPHAGDGGVIGNEEEKTIIPAITRAYDQGMLAFGPYPADGFFGSGNYTRFDGILAMYHDQGLLPFKLLAFEEGVNFTAGLTVVRTSPAHGTAYDIAGKNQASPDSFKAAIYQAVDIFRNRKEFDERNKNPLPYVAKDQDMPENAIE